MGTVRSWVQWGAEEPHRSHDLRSNPTAWPTSPPEPASGHAAPQGHRTLPTPVSPAPSPWGGDSRNPGRPWLHSSARTPLCGQALHSTSPRTRCGRQGGTMVSPRAPPTPPPMSHPHQPCAHHHQECRKPGGSPSVMFFSHRICRGEGRKVRANGLALSDPFPSQEAAPTQARGPGNTGAGNQQIRAREPGGGQLGEDRDRGAGHRSSDGWADTRMPAPPLCSPQFPGHNPTPPRRPDKNGLGRTPGCGCQGRGWLWGPCLARPAYLGQKGLG